MCETECHAETSGDLLEVMDALHGLLWGAKDRAPTLVHRPREGCAILGVLGVWPPEYVHVVLVVPALQAFRNFRDRLLLGLGEVPLHVDPPVLSVHHLAVLLRVGLAEPPLRGQRRQPLDAVARHRDHAYPMLAGAFHPRGTHG